MGAGSAEILGKLLLSYPISQPGFNFKPHFFGAMELRWEGGRAHVITIHGSLRKVMCL